MDNQVTDKHSFNEDGGVVVKVVAAGMVVLLSKYKFIVHVCLSFM
jgi:hypothetical protein